MSAHVSVSTSLYSKQYLAKAWQERGQLNYFERRGFAQFFYATICGHLEAILAAYIKARLMTSLVTIRWETLPPVRFNDCGTSKIISIEPITSSIKSILTWLEKDLSTAPLSRLTEIYSIVFAKKLSIVVGNDLHDAINALAAIRNLFVHGREFFLKFKDDTFLDKPMEITLDGHPLQHAAKVLHKAKIIKELNFNGTNHDTLRSAFYGDDALLFFYKAVNDAETSLKLARDYEPEIAISDVPPLPILS